MTWDVRSATRLAAAQWQATEAEHHRRVDALVEGFLHRRSVARRHPVEDFLFIYYQHSPARLRRWHPGPGVLLEPGPDPGDRLQWRYYTQIEGGVGLDVPAYLTARLSAVTFVRDLLAATASRPAYLGCWGLHEWAMAYQTDEHRHPEWPLRLGRQGTDEVVHSHAIRCSHADAFRFFTPAALPRNELQPTRATQLEHEQPGCLHATMDLYKWAFKLSPGIPSELTLACFELARAARELDMKASPYDLRELGVEPIAIETASGKVQYRAAQQAIATQGAELRSRLHAVCQDLLHNDREEQG